MRNVGVPPRVDQRFLQKHNIAAGNEWALLSALKFLEIVDEHGVPTHAYRLLQTTDRFENTRIFLVHPLISLSVFPIGNDYHLPHHLFPLVPHYNLRKLHDLLLETDEYRRQAIEVHGYFVPSEHPPEHPTVLDLMTR